MRIAAVFTEFRREGSLYCLYAATSDEDGVEYGIDFFYYDTDKDADGAIREIRAFMSVFRKVQGKRDLSYTAEDESFLLDWGAKAICQILKSMTQDHRIYSEWDEEQGVPYLIIDYRL